MVVAPTLPNGDDQGSVQIEEKDQRAEKVVCWFSKDQAEQFSQVTGNQYLTVKGVFNGEAGARQVLQASQG